MTPTPPHPAAAAGAVEKDNKRITTGWTFYDWANSVYPLVITSSIFPIYWSSVIKQITHPNSGQSPVGFLGMNRRLSKEYDRTLRHANA